MPNRRHSIRKLGAVSFPGSTAAVDMGEFTKGVVHIDGTGAVFEMQCSPDGASTWVVLMRPNGVRGRFTISGVERSYQIPIMPKLFKGLVTTADLDAGYIEGIREVA